MKNKFLTLVALAAAAMTTACSGDTLATDAEQQPQEPQTVSLTASVDGDNTTRVGMSRDNGKVSFYWHADDMITVQIKKKDDADYLSKEHFSIATDTETGAKTATFKGKVDAGYEVGTYALYPEDGAHRMGNDRFTYYLQTSYSYRTVDSNIFPKTTDGVTTYPQNSIRMPMLGTISNGNISFKHLGGVLLIRVDKMPTEKGAIVVSTDQRLWGSYLIQDPESSAPYIASSLLSSSTSDGDHLHAVTLNYSGATVGGVGVFYLPVPTGEYTNIKIQLGSTSVATFGDLKVERGDVVTIPVYQGTDGSSYGCDYVVNGHKFIDLCLPSGTLWAETNVGADNDTDYGNYYAWGETETKTTYTSDNYDTDNTLRTTYATAGQMLAVEHDAATVNWGSFCRMPTDVELKELLNNCTWTWTTNGFQVTSKKNGKSIFLPAGGRIDDSTTGLGEVCRYWSRKLASDNPDYAVILWQASDAVSLGPTVCDRSFGLPIRPVAKKVGYEFDEGSVDNMDMNDFDDDWK